ncbi:DNA polymerase III subunit delta [Patescibacteria group bacterium]|nr:MAG: DNA polymerase III subunit delta [Patescibacteria group bacterium]
MLIFLYGADTYRSREKLRELRQSFAEKHDPDGVNIIRLDGAKIAADDLSGALRSQPFFGQGKRLVIVEGLLAKKNADHEALAVIFPSIPETTVLVLWDELSSETAKKIALLKKFPHSPNSTHHVFDPLTGPSLTKWVKDEVKRRQGKIEARAVQHLVEHVGADLWRLHGEIEKLLAYSSGAEIRSQDVEALTEGEAEENIFAILDAISAKNFSAASRLIRAQVAGGLEEQLLLSMLLRQVRILLMARSYLSQSPRAGKEEVARELGLHPFVAQKTIQAAKNFSPALLVRLVDSLFNAERGIKTGRFSPSLAVEQILVSMAANEVSREL